MSTENSIQEETWRPIPGFEGYEASDFGRIRSLKRKAIRTLVLKTNSVTGYQEVNVSVGKVARTAAVHRLVAVAFFGPLSRAEFVNHKDRCRTNNHLSNLDVTSATGNVAHRVLADWIQAALRSEADTIRAIIREEIRAFFASQPSG